MCDWYKSFLDEGPGRRPMGSSGTTRGKVTKIWYCNHPKHSKLPKSKFSEVMVPRDKWLKCGGDQNSELCQLTEEEINDV